ncbi:hypothetical protein PHYBLDRAFT_72469 [Phycomyces blakesleeanus NRRL 1555(-)]|uniref:Uncharacterized protein n=1 Tax=Phycomyces blakesleeanus (strain ATCC 8743b / DSM 1359 / FGSC 10004 / NBRC 33097 / NRRL 1555) TaxID=763407 RepID=A0A162TA04_PHYB8|nr:hypothetical protein PHYBLDRAFT_72469 [Phycomyces blakesleeanus NRRL 1555(-)]OAD65393.1 hypothetical protein PHYBLDRAFT_72469 [Phycomyces blakesleeanus NRRL 1555(-)]|eukprot:XP_018283433.1 hypothetical protein PHYBLDRAFT_72469 [Phycomyces blakesleeanus NRRL 1555(-)]
MTSTEENDYEAFVAAGEVQNTGDPMAIEFESNYIKSNEYGSNNYDSDSSNDYSSEHAHGYLHICNPLNSRNIPIESEVTENGNEETQVFFYKANTNAEAATLELFSIFVKNNISHNVFDKCVKILINILATTSSFMTYYKKNMLLKEEYTVHTDVYDMYKKGCVCFCVVKAGHQIFKIVTLSQQLKFKLSHSQKQARMAYGRSCIMADHVSEFLDVFNGNVVYRLCESSIVGQDNILITIFIDQFNSFDDTKMSATIIHIVNFNINLEERYKSDNMIQLAIISESKHPKNIGSFLESIIQDLQILTTSDIWIQAFTEQVNRYGFKGLNVFRDLPTLTSYVFFGLDEMHLLGYDIGKQLYTALGGKFQISSEITHNENQ